MVNGSGLSHLADLANVPQPPPYHPQPAAERWQSHRATQLPPSRIPNKSVKAALTESLPTLFPRNGHAVSNPNADGEVYIFGGCILRPSLTYLNDLWLYSTRDNTTTTIQCYGDLPSPRSESSISVIGKLLTLWGGGTNESCDDALYLLDLVTHEWTKVTVHGQPPAGRRNHAFATTGSVLYIFGGGADIRELYPNDIWSFDLSTLRSQPAWKLIKSPSQERPGPRIGQECVLYKNKLFTFGGFDMTNGHHSDMWSFDLETSRWTEVKYSGQTPTKRSFHAATVVDDAIFYHGGFSPNKVDDLAVFHIPTRKWFIFEPTPPGHRSEHSLVSLGSSVYMLGGRTVGERDDLDLIFILNTETIEELPHVPKEDERKKGKEKSGAKGGEGEGEQGNGKKNAGGEEDQGGIAKGGETQAPTRTFPAMIRVQGQGGQEELYSKFLLEGLHENPETEVEEVWSFSINTDIAMTSFYSRGADMNPARSLLTGTYQRIDQFAGFDGFSGRIGNGRFYLRTNRGVVVKGEIVGGPPHGQSFAGTGTWYRA